MSLIKIYTRLMKILIGIQFINCNTVYTFHCKCTNKYLNELNKYTLILHTDTTFVCNKLSIENVSFNYTIQREK